MPSTQTLIAVRCIGRSRSRWRTPGRRMIGRIAATIGRKRTLDSVTASATSNSDAVVRVETRMTCAGAAQISTRGQRHPPEAEADLVGQRAQADVVADQHVEEHRADGGDDAVEKHLERDVGWRICGLDRHELNSKHERARNQRRLRRPPRRQTPSGG